MSMLILFAKNEHPFPYDGVVGRLGIDVGSKPEQRKDTKHDDDEIGAQFQQTREPWTRGRIYSDRIVFEANYLLEVAWVRELARDLNLAFIIDGYRIE